MDVRMEGRVDQWNGGMEDGKKGKGKEDRRGWKDY